jgi:hypothetical protein
MRRNLIHNGKQILTSDCNMGNSVVRVQSQVRIELVTVCTIGMGPSPMFTWDVLYRYQFYHCEWLLGNVLKPIWCCTALGLEPLIEISILIQGHSLLLSLPPLSVHRCMAFAFTWRCGMYRDNRGFNFIDIFIRCTFLEKQVSAYLWHML